MEVQQFPGGYSNLTYLLRFGHIELVLRRPPAGPIPVRAHDMAREFFWLAALNPVFPLAPEPWLLCEDPGVIGSVFYVMERRDGLVIREDEPEELREHPTLRRRVGEALVDTLAKLHSVDAATPSLAGLGKPSGFVARQVSGWADRWTRAKTSEIAEMEALAQWLHGHVPPEGVAAVVHGDFKLDNVVLDRHDLTRVVGVLDWEMCALGDPLVDLGMLLVYWIHTQAATGTPDSWSSLTGRPGWLVRDEILGRYASVSSRDLANIGYYERLALFKLAVILQQLYLRHVRGQTDDTRLAHLGERVLALARYAAMLTP
jgi:aminoglycoside phosphotransferase (APT) family kinase protein